MPRCSGSSSSMISIARTLGAPDTVPAGKPADQRVERVAVRAELALDVGDDVHDVAVALDDQLLGDPHRADLGDAADVVAAEVEQHQVLGALLGIGQQLVRQRLVLGRRRAAPAGAGERADGDRAVAQPHQDLRARADQREVAEVEEEQERRGVEPAQRAVERERRQRETAARSAARAPPGRCRRRGCTPSPARPSRDTRSRVTLAGRLGQRRCAPSPARARCGSARSKSATASASRSRRWS